MNGSGDYATAERMINEIEKYRKVSIDITKISVRRVQVYEDDYKEYNAKLNKTKK